MQGDWLQGDPLLTSIGLLDRADHHPSGQAPPAAADAGIVEPRQDSWGASQLPQQMTTTSIAALLGLPDLPDLLATNVGPGFDFLMSPAPLQRSEALPARGPVDSTARSAAADRSGLATPVLQAEPSAPALPAAQPAQSAQSPWTFSASPTTSRFPAAGQQPSAAPEPRRSSAPDEALASALPSHAQKFRAPKHHLERPHPYQRRDAAHPPQGQWPSPGLPAASDATRGTSQTTASPTWPSAAATEPCSSTRAGDSPFSSSSRSAAPSPTTSDSATLTHPQTPDAGSTLASSATLTSSLPAASPHSLQSPPSPYSPYSRSSRTSSEDTSRTSRRSSRSDSVTTTTTHTTHTSRTWPSTDSAVATTDRRAPSGAATVAAAVALESLKKQAARLEAVIGLPLHRVWPAEPAADFFQAAVLVNGWPEDLAVQYLDFTVRPPLRRVLRNAMSDPSGASGAPLPVSITRHADGHLDAGLTTTPADLRPTIAATPLGHLDAITCGLRWIQYGPYEQALSALLATFRMPLNDLKRDINAQGHPSGSYALALKAMAVTVRSQTAMHQLQLAMEHARLMALTGQASRPLQTGAAVPAPDEVIKIE